MIYFIYIYHIHLFHGKIWTHNWPTPNISGFLAQLVRASHRYQTPLMSWIFFRLLTQLHKLCSIAWTFFIWFHFRSSFMIYFIYIYHNKNVLDCVCRRRSASSCVCSFPILRSSPLKSNVWKWVLFAWAGITNLDIHGYWISMSKSGFRLPLLKSIL